jgi:hypothetical protein
MIRFVRDLPAGTVTFLFTDIEGRRGSSTSSARMPARTSWRSIAASYATHDALDGKPSHATLIT